MGTALRRSLVLVSMTLLVSGLFLAVPPAPVAAREPVCFAETGQCIQGRFLAYWQAHGGLALNGYPLSGERQELLEDGRTYTVQYFERVRLEYHPENPPPWDVLLGQFGRRVLRDTFGPDVARYQAAIAPATPAPGTTFFPQTGHNLGGGFRDSWYAHDGLAQFGYPLTEEFQQQLADGQTYTVQYFERARLEWHPGAPAPWDIAVGQFGRQILAENALLGGRFGSLYTTNARVRGRLGAPTAPAFQVPGASQPFERGQLIMFRNGTVNAIAVLCGDPQTGVALVSSRLLLFFQDPGPGQPVGGIPGPPPGRYEPQGPLGNVWRQSAGGGRGGTTVGVRDCLGYATTPGETAYTVTVQFFSRGLLLSTPDEQAYILWIELAPNGSLVGYYERVALPATR